MLEAYRYRIIDSHTGGSGYGSGSANYQGI